MEMFLDSMFRRLQCGSPLFLISKDNCMKRGVSCYSHISRCILLLMKITISHHGSFKSDTSRGG